jgi:hypothetical protein
LGIERRGDRIWSGGEGGLDGFSRGLEHHTAVGLDSSTQEGELALDGRGHRPLIALPECRAVLDVREEEGHGA